MTDNINDDITDDITDNMTDDMTDDITDNMTDDITDEKINEYGTFFDSKKEILQLYVLFICLGIYEDIKLMIEKKYIL